MANSTGIDRETGLPLTDWDHVVQSVQVIWTTRIGSRVMRRHFGSEVPVLFGRLFTAQLMLQFKAALVAAIDTWEPRLRVRKITVDGSAEEIRLGHVRMNILADYRPRGHKGDPTVDSIKLLVLTLSGGQLVSPG